MVEASKTSPAVRLQGASRRATVHGEHEPPEPLRIALLVRQVLQLRNPRLQEQFGKRILCQSGQSLSSCFAMHNIRRPVPELSVEIAGTWTESKSTMSRDPRTAEPPHDPQKARSNGASPGQISVPKIDGAFGDCLRPAERF